MRKTRILIVDDDTGMTETLSDILSDMGYNTAVADDGYRAIEIISKDSFDIALIDIKMPGINGVETFKRIKQISPKTKVIMITAYSASNLTDEALNEGAYSLLSKPLNINKFISLVEMIKNGACILVVDDDQNTCDTLKDILEDRNYAVGVAHSGEEALSLVKAKHYDIMFIDIKLPALNGLETYLAIKDVKPEITAIMITGYRQEASNLVKEAVRNNAYTCLYKPLEADKVVTLVERVSRQKQEGTLEKPV
jgi:DNA-binding NtrC family response regulator